LVLALSPLLSSLDDRHRVTAIENAAPNAVRDYLNPSENAVATQVNFHHLAATPVGHRVTAEAVVTKVDG
jgi:fluoroacetyl-CoA thioesterase